jgi:hypothetical protein
MSLQGVTMVLRNLRSRLDLDRALAAAGDDSAWPLPLRECTADLDAYDQALVSAATMVEVDLPPQPPGERRFDPDQRRQVERGLAAAGIDLGLDGDEDR